MASYFETGLNAAYQQASALIFSDRQRSLGIASPARVIFSPSSSRRGSAPRKCLLERMEAIEAFSAQGGNLAAHLVLTRKSLIVAGPVIPAWG